MDVQACISAITVREGIYDLLAELKARMFWGRRFLLFLKHRCLVTLRELFDKICHQRIRDDDNSYREEEFDRYNLELQVLEYWWDTTFS